MRIWLALLLAPLLALGQQSLSYSLVTPSCHRDSAVLLHMVGGGGLLLCVAATIMAMGALSRARRRGISAVAGAHQPQPQPDGHHAEALRRHFLARMAVWMGLLSSLVSAVMWLTVWMLSPCVM